MSRKRAKVDEEASIDMTPMLDIVFILLIFFIITTSFVKEDGIDWTMPENNPDEKTKSQVLAVRIDEFGMLTIKGRQIDVSSLQANVESELIKAKYSGAVVQTSEQAATGILVSTVDQIKLAGISQVQVIKVEQNP